MTHDIDASLPEYTQFNLDQLAQGCQVSREWIIERVQSGLLWHDETSSADPASWSFDSRSFVRIRRIVTIERDFECNAELASLVADMIEEIETLRAKLHVVDSHAHRKNSEP